MNINSKIVAVGDLHGDFRWLNKFIARYKPEVLIQCGDFGYWPRAKWYKRFMKYTGIQAGDTKVYWIDGNHEDHHELAKLTDYEIQPNVFYQPRGSMITLPDGREVLFAGGAYSIDRPVREPGVSWFQDEVLSERDLEKFPDPNTKVDIVISHTCPNEFYQRGNAQIVAYFGKPVDPSRESLSWVLDTYKPPKWYYGHWHYHSTGNDKGCEWECLDTSDNDNKTNWIQI